MVSSWGRLVNSTLMSPVGGTGNSSSVRVTAAAPDLEVSTVEVARTVREVAASPAATVRRPPALMVVPVPPPSTVQVTNWAGLLVPVTVALNCWVPPLAMVGVAGLTETALTVEAGDSPSVRVMTAVLDLVVSTVDVARTVREAAASPAATVRGQWR
jgi:hypothetical protein